MQILRSSSYLNYTPEAVVSLNDTIERLKAISRLSEKEWLDLLGMTWQNYQQFKIGLGKLPDKSLERLSDFFMIPQQNILAKNLDFKDIAIRISKNKKPIPDYYMVAPYGRRRTTITSIEFLEKSYGWRLKQDVLSYFGVNETDLLDPFAPISMRLITQVCDYLSKRTFNEIDFYNMGLYSVEGNKNSLLFKMLSQAESVQDLFTYFFNEIIFLYENNCTYNYTPLGHHEGMLVVKSIPDVAHELGLSHLGNEHICSLKRGLWACIPAYMGLPYATVIHTTCEHKGHDACRFYIDMSPSIKKLTS